MTINMRLVARVCVCVFYTRATAHQTGCTQGHRCTTRYALSGRLVPPPPLPSMRYPDNCLFVNFFVFKKTFCYPFETRVPDEKLQ